MLKHSKNPQLKLGRKCSLIPNHLSLITALLAACCLLLTPNCVDGAISGKVTDGTGAPIQYIYLKAYDVYTQAHINYAVTGVDGKYCISGLPTGTYKVRTFNNQGYADVYYVDSGNWDNAIPIPVSAGDTTFNIDIVLRAGGCLSGKVLANDSVTPIGYINILVYDAYTEEVIADGQSVGDGTYLIKQLPDRDIKVKTWNFGGYIDVYYEQVTDWDDATIISITPPDTAKGIDFFLERGGGIEGVVRSSDSLPLSEIEIEVYSSKTGELVSEGASSAEGVYIITGIPTGDYKLRSKNQQGYIDVYYTDVADWDSATEVQVESPDTTWDIDFMLEYGASILGQIVDSSSGIGLEDISVTVYDITGATVKSGISDSGGFYLVNGLQEGGYKIKTRNYKNYIDVYYKDVVEWDLAQVINLSSSDTVHIDFELKLGGGIEGYVYDPGLNTFPGTYIHAFYSNTGELIRSDQVKSDGSYMIPGLPTYSFKVFVAGGERNDTGFAFEWYQDKSSWDSASVVSISTPGDIVSNINFKLDIGGSISGYVYTADSVALPGAIVNLWIYWSPDFGWIKWESVHSGADGSYILKGIPSSRYLVDAEKSNYETQWYDGVSDSSLATLVSVEMPENTGGIDFYLYCAGVEENENANCKLQIAKLEAYPNPFTAGVRVQWSGISEKQKISLRIYDLSGRLVKSFSLTPNPLSLTTAVKWDGRDNRGKKVGSGIYFYQLKAGDKRITKKLVLIR